ASGALLGDAELDAYLAQVARRLSTARGPAPRALRSARTNAFALPNGAIYLTTGVLALAADEAELAAVLGHELAHVARRHALVSFHRARTSRGVFLLTPHADYRSALARTYNQLEAFAAFGQDQEREADRDALALASAGGYDPAATADLLERLAARATSEGLHEPDDAFATHPRLEERIALVRKAVASSGAPRRERGAAAYDEHVAPALAANAALEAALGRYAVARAQARRGAAGRPRDPAAQVALGEVARREATADADAEALAAFRRAIALDPTMAAAWRGAGLVAARRGPLAEARAALARYLELAPDAGDAPLARAALSALGAGER
ncbi:MAG: M48 family metallopeptidase, partial [Anaeromyxobacteraceae bacterium]